MQISHRIPQLAPQILMRAPRHMWLLTVALIVLYFVMRSSNQMMPIPVPLLLISVAISGAVAGLISGTLSGLLLAVFIMYWWSIDIGPPPLTGTLTRALIACSVSIALGVFLGFSTLTAFLATRFVLRAALLPCLLTWCTVLSCALLYLCLASL